MSVNEQDQDRTGIRDRAAEIAGSARERAIDAYDSVREQASAASGKAGAQIEQAPLIALAGGLAAGALLAALLPKTKAEEKLLGPVGARITDQAKSAAEAAKQAGQEKLAELNLTRDAGSNVVQSIISGLGEAARSSGTAAVSAVRKKD